jgi:exodeoxyribonuclease V gamma subunit
MSLQINVSNSLKELASDFAGHLKKSSSDVFQPYNIITQTVGMNNWLKLTLSENLGILANCRFARPNDIANQIYHLLNGEKKQVLNSESLQWAIYDQLADPKFVKAHKRVADYYTEEPVKRMALAEKVTDLFDQYQMYRYKMIESWNTGKLVTKDPDEIWQQWLWEKAKKQLGDQVTDRVAVHRYIFQHLQEKKAQETIKEHFSRLNFFGLSIITGFHIALFKELAKHIDISFYILNLAPGQAWLDEITEKKISKLNVKSPVHRIPTSGNRLLSEWGNVVRNTFYSFLDGDVPNLSYSESRFREPSTSTLLGKIQHDIFNNADERTRNPITAKDIDDGSLTINSCYTPVREVEVLYNFLANQVDKGKDTISPQDILVIISDINKYAPYIKAIFDTAPYKFPYTIADQAFTETDSIFTALLQLLDLGEENFKAESVLQLLDSKYLQERFGISDVTLLRTATHEANIRLGIEGRMDDDTQTISFKNGIKRILYGVCLKGDEPFPLGSDEIYPVELAEGSQAYQLIRFCHFVEVLIDFIQARKQGRTLTDWISYTNDLVENLIFSREDELESDHYQLMRILEKLNLSGKDKPEVLSYDVFKYILKSMISTENKASNFGRGGITFCSMIPMRSIPFKIVAVLGLDLDKFPRKEHPLGYDLMNKYKQRGDRDVKENDKHLFLETLLSAEELLYMSYIGRSVKDNSRIPPSALIDSLLDYIEVGFKTGKVREKIITQHPLHGFSKQYNSSYPKLFSYLGDGNPMMPKPGKKNTVARTATEVRINDLVSFFKSPFKYYYNKVLGIYEAADSHALLDTEKFDLGNQLEQWVLKNDLLKLDDSKTEQYRKDGVMKGLLPLKNFSIIELESLKEEVAPVKSLFDNCRAGASEDFQNIDHKFGKYSLTGKLTRLYGKKLIHVSLSSMDYKYVLEAYIHWLVAQNCGLTLDVHFISKSKGKVFEGAKISKADASKQLQYLIDLFETGHQMIVPYSPGYLTKPANMIAYSPQDLYDMIEDAIGKERSYDEYLNLEYYSGYFDNDKNLKQFLSIYKGVHESLATVFGDIFIG